MELKKELKCLGLVFVLLAVAFKIAFYQESFIVVARTAFSVMWTFILPGFAVVYCWKSLPFITRAIISIPVSAAIIGTASYYLALLGFNVNYHAAVLPLVVIMIGVMVNWRIARKKQGQKKE